MSLTTWKKEFYPEDAGKVSAKDALAHSLRKWEGILPENLKKHDVFLDEDHKLRGKKGPPMGYVTGNKTCALCHHHWHYFIDTCDDCPLTAVGACCLDYNSPYERATKGMSKGKPLKPKLMITALKRAQKYEAKQPRKVKR